MENKHKINLFKGIFLILLFTFTTLYIASYNGYYEYSNNKKVTLTNEKIKEFEEDVKNGKKIDLENYIVMEKNNKKRIGLKLSLLIEKKTNKALRETFKVLSKMIEN